MPTAIATPERIRRIRRESEFARWMDHTILAARPDARDGYAEVRESFFSKDTVAQAMTDELAPLLGLRVHEAAEITEPVRLGDDVPITPVLPKVRMVDNRRGLDVTIPIKGISIDHETQRNAIEAMG